jgi:hypothetical protein
LIRERRKIMIKKGWAIIKDSPHPGIQIDTEKQQIKYNKDLFLVRFETTNKIWIWRMDPKVDPKYLNKLGKIREENL